MASPRLTVQDGRWEAQQPLSGQEEMLFPEPVGRATAVYSLHSECATFPVSFKEKGVRYVSFKIAFPTDFMHRLKFLVDLGFGSDEPLNLRGVQVSPREVLTKLVEAFPVESVEPQDCDVLRVVTTGEAAGRKLEITNQVVVQPYQRWGVSAAGPPRPSPGTGASCRRRGTSRGADARSTARPRA